MKVLPMKRGNLTLAIVLLSGWGGGLQAELTVTTEFEGGSAIVEMVDSVRSEVHIRPGGDPERRLAIFLDLHNPGPNDQRPFFFVGPADRLPDAARANRDRFLMFAARRLDGPLALDATPRVTGTTYHPLWRQISGVWVSEHTDTDAVAACLETAWNTPHSSVAGYRGVGAKLGQAVADYLRLHCSAGP